MTDVLLVLPLLATPDFSTSAVDNLLVPVGEQQWQWGGEVWVGKGFASSRFTELVAFGAVGASTTAFALGDKRFDGTGWTGALEGGPRWSYGGGLVRGWSELGVGLHARIGLPDWSEGAWTLGLGTHAATGVDFGTGTVRPRLGLLSVITIAPTSYSGTVQLPEGNLTWAWNASRIEMALTFGAAFGGPAAATPPQ